MVLKSVAAFFSFGKDEHLIQGGFGNGNNGDKEWNNCNTI